MGLTIHTMEQQELIEQVTMSHRLYLTADKDRVVQEGHPEARFLYCVPGTRVARKEAEQLGAIPPKEPADPPIIKETKPTVKSVGPKPQEK